MTDPPAASAAESADAPKSRTVKYAIGLAVVGVGLLLWARISTSGLQVAYLPITDRGGQPSSVRFTLPETGSYEVELELQAKNDFDQMDAQYGTAGEIPELNLEWVISNDGQAVAQGTAQQYLYVSTDWFKQRFAKWIVGARQYHNIRNSRIGRGIGKFQGRAKTEYELTATIQAWPEDPSFADPHLVVLVDRRSRARVLTSANGMAVVGIVSLTLAGVASLFIAARRLVR